MGDRRRPAPLLDVVVGGGGEGTRGEEPGLLILESLQLSTASASSCMEPEREPSAQQAPMPATPLCCMAWASAWARALAAGMGAACVLRGMPR